MLKILKIGRDTQRCGAEDSIKDLTFNDSLPGTPRVAMEQNLLPPGWQAVQDPQTGRTYYQNTVTQTTQWEPPFAGPSPVSDGRSAAPSPATGGRSQAELAAIHAAMKQQEQQGGGASLMQQQGDGVGGGGMGDAPAASMTMISAPLSIPVVQFGDQVMVVCCTLLYVETRFAHRPIQ